MVPVCLQVRVSQTGVATRWSGGEDLVQAALSYTPRLGVASPAFLESVDPSPINGCYVQPLSTSALTY
jgi:hypothetical protein